MMRAYIKKLSGYFAKQTRDPRYVFVLLAGSIVFFLCTLQVLSKGLFDSVERPVFRYFNSLPHFLHGPMLALTQFGGLGGLVFWMAVAWYLVNRRAAFTVIGASITAWFLAKIAKNSIARGRPFALLDHINSAVTATRPAIRRFRPPARRSFISRSRSATESTSY
jgi:hypothetical protein